MEVGQPTSTNCCTAIQNTNEIIDLSVNISLIANSLVKDAAVHLFINYFFL
jgi:hypothetical protein